MREELFGGQEIEGKHEGLIAIVAGAEVALPKGVRQSQLRDLFAFAEDSELCPPGEDLAPSKDAALAATVCDPIIAAHGFQIPATILTRFVERSIQRHDFAVYRKSCADYK